MKPRESTVWKMSALGMLVLAIAGGSARADRFVFDSSNGDPNSGPYGTVTVTGGGSRVFITIDVAAGYQLVGFGFNVAAGTQLLATSPFSLALTGSTKGASSWNYNPGNNSDSVGTQTKGGFGPFGKYSYSVSKPNDTGVTQAVLTISGTHLTLSQFEGLSKNGSAVFAAHLKPTAGGDTYKYGAHLVVVPEPPTIAIASTIVVASAGHYLRRRRAKPA